MVIAFIIFISLLLRIIGINFGLPFDGLHPTESFSILNALSISRGTPPLSLQHPFLFPYLISAFSFIFSKNTAILYLIGRFISFLSSSLTVYFFYKFLKTNTDKKNVIFLSTSFLGFNLLLIKYSHYSVPDSLCLLFIMLTSFAIFKLIEKPSLKNYLKAGLLGGLSCGAKFYGITSLGFFIMGYILTLKKSKFLHFLLGFLLFSLIVSFGSLYQLKNLSFALREFSLYFSEKGVSSPFSYAKSGIWLYPLVVMPAGFGRITFLICLLGIRKFFSFRKKEFLAVGIPSFLYLAAILNEKGATLQNIFPLLPFFSLCFFYFFKYNSKKVFLLLGILGISLNFLRSVIFSCSLLYPDTRVLAYNYIAKNIPTNSKLAFEPYTPFDITKLTPSLLTKKFKSFLFIPSLAINSYQTYQNEKFNYLITSGFRENFYYFLCKKHKLCGEYHNYSSFRKFTLIKEFSPPKIFKYSNFGFPFGSWPHNPRIRIYRLF